jgi:hypothetical protein
LIKNAAATFAPHSKHFAENIERIVEPTRTGTPRSAGPKRGMPKLVVRSPFILVYENLIGLSQLFKLLLGC